MDTIDNDQWQQGADCLVFSWPWNWLCPSAWCPAQCAQCTGKRRGADMLRVHLNEAAKKRVVGSLVEMESVLRIDISDRHLFLLQCQSAATLWILSTRANWILQQMCRNNRIMFVMWINQFSIPQPVDVFKSALKNYNLMWLNQSAFIYKLLWVVVRVSVVQSCFILYKMFLLQFIESLQTSWRQPCEHPPCLPPLKQVQMTPGCFRITTHTCPHIRLVRCNCRRRWVIVRASIPTFFLAEIACFIREMHYGAMMVILYNTMLPFMMWDTLMNYWIYVVVCLWLQWCCAFTSYCSAPSGQQHEFQER